MGEVMDMLRGEKEEWQRQKEQVKDALTYMTRGINAFAEVAIYIPEAKGFTEYEMFKKALSFITSKNSGISCEFKSVSYCGHNCADCAVIKVKLPTFTFKEYLEDKVAELITDARELADFLSGFKTLVALVSESKE